MITYRAFRALVNQKLIEHSGMGLDCLADTDISDFWDSDFSDADADVMAHEAAMQVLADNDFPFNVGATHG